MNHSATATEINAVRAARQKLIHEGLSHIQAQLPASQDEEFTALIDTIRRMAKADPERLESTLRIWAETEGWQADDQS